MPSNTMNTDIVLNGVSAAWAYPFVKNGSGKYHIPGITATTTAERKAARFRFNNLKTPRVKIIRPDAVTQATAEEFASLTRADGNIIEFVKSVVKIDGATGEAKSGGASSSTGSKAEAGFISQQTDIDSEHYITYLDKLKSYVGSIFLVCVPLGYNYLRKKAGATTGDTNALGFAWVLGTLGSDPEHVADNYTPTPLTWSFTTKKLAITADDILAAHAAVDLGVGDATTWVDDHAILVPEGMSGADVMGPLIKPASLSVLTGTALTADFQKLIDGEAIFKVAA